MKLHDLRPVPMHVWEATKRLNDAMHVLMPGSNWASPARPAPLVFLCDRLIAPGNMNIRQHLGAWSVQVRSCHRSLRIPWSTL